MKNNKEKKPIDYNELWWIPMSISVAALIISIAKLLMRV